MPAEPPRITITDPSRPGEPVDVMTSGDDKEPWRASRRQKAVVAGAVVVALLAVAAVQLVRHQREQDRLDAASLTDVSLALTTNPTDDQVSDVGAFVVLRNDSAATVRVLSVALDLPGVDRVRVDQDAAAAAFLPFVVPDTLTCSPTLAAELPPVSATARIRTARGVEADVPATVLSDALTSVLGRARDRCRYFPPRQALSSVTGTTQRVGRTLVAELAWSNSGILPLNVTGVSTALMGLSVEVDQRLPLSLPDGSVDEQGVPVAAEVGVRLTFTVTDCGLARPAVLPDLDPEVLVQVRGGTEEGVASIGIDPEGRHPLSDLVVDLCR